MKVKRCKLLSQGFLRNRIFKTIRKCRKFKGCLLFNLRDYKRRLGKEKFMEFDQERIAKLDEEIESLIQQKRALFFIEEKGYAAIKCLWMFGFFFVSYQINYLV